MSVKNVEGKHIEDEVQSTACNQAISDIRTVRAIICNVIDKPAATSEKRNLCLVIVHKIFRYLYISVYFYIMPFMIICFRTILLYYGEIYTNNKKTVALPSTADASSSTS